MGTIVLFMMRRNARTDFSSGVIALIGAFVSAFASALVGALTGTLVADIGQKNCNESI
jgi:hypothetical protein